jgi:hypothetical protein
MSDYEDAVSRMFPVSTGERRRNDLNLPWMAVRVYDDWALPNGAFPWLILDVWGVVIGRFDREDQAQAVVDAAAVWVRQF